MKVRHPDMQWQVMDVRDMSFPDTSFDIAVDKATLDAMLYGSLWDPEDEVQKNVSAYVSQVIQHTACTIPFQYLTTSRSRGFSSQEERGCILPGVNRILSDRSYRA